MSIFLYVEVNAVGALLLLLLLINICRNSYKVISIDQKLFNSIMFLNLLIFIFDTGMWLMDGKLFWGLQNGMNITTVLYYISNPFICFLWLLYTDIKIYENRLSLTKRIPFYAIPLFINTVMSLMSPFTQWLFVIDGNNHYSRGPFFWVMAAISFFYLGISLCISINEFFRSSWEKNKSMNLYLLFFSILVIIAAVLQTLYFGITIIWISSMLGCVCIYINIQNKEVSTDHLTGLFNRRRLDQHLLHRIKAKRHGRMLFAILIDLDEFKSINDNQGHTAGDDALVQTAKVLKEACNSRDDFIARFGGDEFVIIGERMELHEINDLIEKLYAKACDYNKNPQSLYTLQYSMGYSVLKENDTPESLLAAADEKMYQNKRKRKLDRV